jgi:ribokinase
LFEIVCIGGVTHDIFFKSKYQILNNQLVFPWKEKVVVDDMDVALGGGGANAAVGFSRLGLKTALLTRVGVGHISTSVLYKLQDERIDTSLMIKDPRAHTATSLLFLDSATGERTIVMYRGRNDFFEDSEIDFGKLLNSKWFYIADLACSDDKHGFVKNMVDRAYSKGLKIAFTPSRRQLSRGLDVLKPIIEKLEVMVLNQYEWDLLTNKLPESEAHTLGAKLVVITKDVNGVTACVGGDKCVNHPAPDIDQVVDTTGAGDAFASGLIAALAKGKSVKEALEWGTKNAGSVISHISAQRGLLTEVEILNSKS